MALPYITCVCPWIDRWRILTFCNSGPCLYICTIVHAIGRWLLFQSNPLTHQILWIWAAQMHQCTSVPVLSAPVHKCRNAPVHKCSSAPVHLQTRSEMKTKSSAPNIAPWHLLGFRFISALISSSKYVSISPTASPIEE